MLYLIGSLTSYVHREISGRKKKDMLKHMPGMKISYEHILENLMAIFFSCVCVFQFLIPMQPMVKGDLMLHHAIGDKFQS